MLVVLCSVLVANDDEAERRPRSPPRHLPVPSTNPDVPRSSGAVSGRFRAGCAARVLVGSVLVACRCIAVVRVLGRSGGGPFGVRRSPGVGVSFGMVPVAGSSSPQGAFGQAEVLRFLFGEPFESW